MFLFQTNYCFFSSMEPNFYLKILGKVKYQNMLVIQYKKSIKREIKKINRGIFKFYSKYRKIQKSERHSFTTVEHGSLCYPNINSFARGSPRKPLQTLPSPLPRFYFPFCQSFPHLSNQTPPSNPGPMFLFRPHPSFLSPVQ